jgi:hypothetical protein
MIDERDKDAANLNQQEIGNGLQILDRGVEIGLTVEGFGICVEVLKQKEAERHDAGQLMQLAQDESPAQTNRQRRTPSLNSNNNALMVLQDRLTNDCQYT